jgi:hypothetical protein
MFSIFRLSGFQHHLGTLSSEIKQLQHETLTLNVKLENRHVRRQQQAGNHVLGLTFYFFEAIRSWKAR